MTINQAVLFTKPVHHLDIALSPDELNGITREFFESNGLSIVYSRRVTGAELAEREIIRQHYLMYSKASYGDIGITPAGGWFTLRFGKGGAPRAVDWELDRLAGHQPVRPRLV